MTIKNLKPELVWGIFHEITQVPRPSKKEGKIREWLINFAQKHNLEYKVDEIGNVAMFRPAAPGFENVPGICMQGHMDMVCEKNSDVNHNFDTDPIETIIDGEWVRANGTTLGADNGIGMAAALAALTDPELKAGPLCALCTVDEETGLTGATKVGEGMIRADYLLNLDSEDDGEICMGCAGGRDSNAIFTYTPTPAPQHFTYFCIAFKKFTGGHSGTDINTERASANKVVSRFLYNWMECCPETVLAEIKGGNLRNAIAREAFAVVGVPASKKEALSVALNSYEADLRVEFKRTETTFEVEIASVPAPEVVIDQCTARRVVAALYSAPHGVTYYSKEMEGLVETSTNLGAIKMPGNNTIVVSTLQRSSVESRKADIVGQVVAHFKLAGANVVCDDGYQGWAPNMDSKILTVAVDAYENLYGEKPKVNAIHAGLECGLFLAKYPHLDMISVGPTMRGVHSPQEKLHIPAVVKYWDLLRGIINAVANK